MLKTVKMTMFSMYRLFTALYKEEKITYALLKSTQNKVFRIKDQRQKSVFSLETFN